MARASILFVSSNINKAKEFKLILEPEINMTYLRRPYREIRADNPDEIAKLSAQMLAEKLKNAIVVDDSGLFINALNGFPGTCSAYIYKRIGLRGILTLMDGVKERKCTYKSAVAYCEPRKEPFVFVGEEKGNIAKNIKGIFGFGYDPIFIPEGYAQTYGEMKDYKEAKKHRRMAVMQLKEFLIMQLL